MIRAAQQLCSDSFYDARTVGQPLYSRLKVVQRLRLENGKGLINSQSLGPFIAVTKVDSGVVHKGYLTTIHGKKQRFQKKSTKLQLSRVINGSILRYIQKNDDDDDDPGIIVKLPVATCSNLKYDARVPVSINNIEYIVGVDFCIAMDENATCSKVLLYIRKMLV